MLYKHKLWKRIVSVFLIVMMFMMDLPAEAMAAELIPLEEMSVGVETEGVVSEEAASEEATSEEPVVIGEDESRRDENTKHFILSDGSRRAVMYSEAVHYEEDGEWKDIDNTLEYEEITGTYKNKANDFRAHFDEDPESDKLLSLEKDGYTISWEYVKKTSEYEVMSAEEDLPMQSAPKLAQKGARTESKDEAGRPIRSAGEPLRYEDMDTSCDIEYVVTGNGVKENIILSEPTGQNTFIFDVTATGLNLVKNEDGSISVQTIGEGEEVFYIPAPFMYDDAGAYSDAVAYTVQSMGTDRFRLVVTADKEWLTAKERVYPVIIDPVIKTEQEREAITCTFISSKSTYKDTNFNAYKMLCVGWDTSAYNKTRTLIKFDLPTLNKGDMVVGATLAMYMYDGSFYASGMGKQQFNVHKVTSSWSASTVTWNSKPSFDSTVSDYGFFKKSDLATDDAWKFLDVTKIVKEWYEGDSNYGLLVKKETESGTESTDAAYAKFWSDKYNDVNDAYPMIAIDYRNNKGLEGYWDYTTVSAGAAGTAYVNDYSGNLVFEAPLASTVGERMTASLSLIYNGYCANVKYVTGKNNSSETVVGRGFRLNLQQTLLPSALYGLDEETASEWPYVYTDGDGTEHYFKKLSTDKEVDGITYEYRDEDGLGLYLTTESSYVGKYEITDGNGNCWYFNTEGNLRCLEDKNGNEVNITFTDGNKKQISKITDANGHYYQFTYREIDDVADDFIKTIRDDAGRVITFYYDEGCLYRIQYSDGTNSYFTYTSKNKCLETTGDADGFGLFFDYLSTNGTIRVSNVIETAGTAEGQEISFDRAAYNTTVVRSGGVDGIHLNQNSANGSDDVITTYQFDNLGRTTSTQVKYGNGVDAGAAVAGYTTSDDDESASPKKNKVSSQAGLGSNVVNLVKNSNVTGWSNWNYTSWGDVEKTVYTVGSPKYMGERSFRINNISMTTMSNSYIYQKCTDYTVGAKYTFSAYVRTSGVTRVISSGIGGAYLHVSAYDASNTALMNAYSATLMGTTDTAIDNGWRRLTVTFTVPENTTTLNLCMCLRSATGYAWFDCMQLEVGSVANDYNMIENSSFENSSGGMPTDWSTGSITYSTSSSGTVQNGVTTARTKTGSKSMRIIGEAKKAKGLSQTIPVERNPDDTYILSGWGFANATNDTFHKDSLFEISVKVHYSVSDGTTTSQNKDGAKFNTAVYGWQYAATTIVLAYQDGDASLTYTPTSIEIICRYWYQENSCYFDHIQLIKDVASSYQYDSKGNVVSVAANAKQKENMTYSGKDLTKYTDPAGNKYTYEYDINHNLTKATIPSGVYNEYTYNSYGTIRTEEISNKAGTMSISTRNSYYAPTDTITQEAYLESTTDAYGNMTTYDYYFDSGLIKSVTAANGGTTEYTYGNNYGKLSQVKNSTSAVNYTYTGNRLSKIVFSDLSNSANKEQYSFDYDAYGNVLETRVGNVALTTNTYGSNNGLLQSSLYANGDGIKYTYDKMGNVSMIYQKQDTNANFDQYSSYFWQYATDGTPLVHQDGKNRLRYEYVYDSIGRLIRQNMTRTTDSAFVGSVEFGYDNRNNLTKMTNAIGSETLTQSYTYNADGLASKYSISPGQYALYEYDGLNRLTSRTFHHNSSSGAVLTNKYSYLASAQGTGYTTTNLQTETIQGTAYNYSYDSLWNITSIKKGSDAYRSYKYDTYGQLLRENNNSTGESTEWTYDDLGNIRTAKTYAYSTDSTLQNPKEEVTYNYGTDADAGWSHLLTSITTTTNNEDSTTTTVTETIDYDAIGNPISYRGATMGWYGRQMTSYSKDGTTITSTYDVEGIRGSKTVNGSKTTYQYIDGKLYYEKRGDGKELYYYHDSYGNLAMIRMFNNGVKSVYYVSTNSQGDVLGLYTYTGELVASYEYDAWGNATITKPGTDGKPIDITNSTEEHIGTINPIRYRGYYYDADMGLYYLQSRYYDASIGRFINADKGISGVGGEILGYNMFAYGFNNPVNYDDSTGNWPKWIETAAKVATVVAVAATAVVVVAVATVGTGGAALAVAGVAFGTACGSLVGGLINESKGGSFIKGATGGAIGGFVQSVGTALAGPAGTIIGGGVGSGIGTAITESWNNEDRAKSERLAQTEIITASLQSGVIGMGMSAVTAGMNYAITDAVSTKAMGLMPSLTPGFGEMLSGFFGSVDDALVNIFVE